MTTRILIVDDELSIVFAMRRYFEGAGYAIYTANQKDQAVSILHQDAIDVVIADLRLSGSEGMEGLELVQLVRSNFPSTRVLILTAFGSPEVKTAAEKLGVDAFMDKPVPLSNIHDVIMKLSLQTIRSHNPMPEPTVEDL